MDKAAFLGLLSRLGIDEGIVVLDDSLRDGYCVRKNGLRWEVSVPMAMVSKIWPVNTAAELEKLFLRAACQAQIAETRMQNGSSYRYGQHSYQKLRNSWLYKHMCNTVGCNAAHDEYTRKLKAKVMQVGMGI